MDIFSIVTLIVYLLLCVPILYIWYRHGRPGFLGWGYLVVFCFFRIVGSGMAINKNSTGNGADILASLGIAPLLLGAHGILAEARTYRNPYLTKYIHYLVILLITAIVTAGIAEAGTGGAAFGGSHPSSDDTTNASIGIGLFFAVWVIVMLWGLFQLRPTQYLREAQGFREGTMLLHAVLASLLFLGIRITYSLVAVASKKKSLDAITGSLGVRILLAFVPELILTLILSYAGFQTREIGSVKTVSPVY